MARQADRLVKIGQEGFAAIDEHFGRAKRRPPVMKKLSTATRRLNAIRGGFMSITLRGNQFRFKDQGEDLCRLP
ncbi:hypothetical protein NC652_018291 [Populus alba x Populus x berolinensis]|nr:hypothetical protein NC652_018291 [Populus alba x Populus x berolinensis]